MGIEIRLAGAALALGLYTLAAQAQEAAPDAAVTLPTIEVGVSRLGTGITGASTSVITAAEIERSPSQSLPDLLARETGVQILHQSGNPLGVNDAVDLRGFGAFAQSNVLILVNGRRYQDFDLQGFDFATIPRNSIERIEVTRGNSGAVLYGDGAVGGVINIVTKTTAEPGAHGRVEGAVGSYGYQEGRFSASNSSGPWTTSFYGNVATVSGYRQNNEVRQDNAIGNINYRTADLSGYLTLDLDRQRQNLPGNLPNRPLVYPTTLDDPRASVFPSDWGHKQDVNITAGVSKTLWSGAELTVDGGVRRKFQKSQFDDYFPAPAFTYDPNSTTVGELRQHRHDDGVADAAPQHVVRRLRPAEPVADRRRRLQHAVRFRPLAGAGLADHPSIQHPADHGRLLRDEQSEPAARPRCFLRRSRAMGGREGDRRL